MPSAAFQLIGGKITAVPYQQFGGNLVVMWAEFIGGRRSAYEPIAILAKPPATLARR
jgi:hypothetical protein